MFQRLKAQASQISFHLSEFSGGLGDLPTFLIFLIAMVRINHLEAAPALVFAGIFNILSGIIFHVPMPVEPMKAIGILAISTGLSSKGVYLSGILMGIIILILSISGLLRLCMRWTPKGVVRGIQLSLGIIVVKQGYDLIPKGGGWFGINGYLMAILVSLFILFLHKNKIIPVALVIFVFGILVVFINNPAVVHTASIQMYLPHLMKLNVSSFDKWASLMGIIASQLPITIANSIIATAMLLDDYFPEHTSSCSVKRIGLSVSLMNLISCPFGGMPMCHGAGGLAAQYRFGARTGLSVVYIGVIKLIGGFLFSGYVLLIATLFPGVLLGSMFIFTGVELATHIKDLKQQSDVFSMILTSGITIASNIAIGFVAGIVSYYGWEYWRVGLKLRKEIVKND